MANLFSNQRTARLSVERLKYRQANKDNAIRFGHDEIDAVLNPLLPGDLLTVIGRPGNGKTAVMLYWARKRAEFLQNNELDDRVVIYVTYEQTVEDLNTIQIAADRGLDITTMARGEITDSEWDAILKGATERAAMPLWYMGHSQDNRRERPNITTENILNTLQKLELDRDYDIDMVFVDYLQRMPFVGRPESKVVGTMNNLDGLKDNALVLNCPFVVGVQARRGVDEKALPVPTMDDGQWTSNIEQASDKILSVMRPRQYKKEGETMGDLVVEGYKQMLITLVKQKLGKANKAWWVYFDPAKNQLGELTSRRKR